MDAWIKLIAAVGLYGLWAVLVFEKMAPADSLVMGIEGALVGLGVLHASGSYFRQPSQPQSTTGDSQ